MILFTINVFAMPNNNYKKLLLTVEEKEWLQQNPNIKLTATIGYEPVLFRDYDGKVKGIVSDYFDYISKVIGQNIQFDYFSVTNSNIIESTKKDNVYGTAILFKTDKYKDIFTFTKSYMDTPFIVFSSKNKTKYIKNKNDLKGKKIAILDNNIAIKKYLLGIDNIKVIYVKTIKEQLELMQYEKVDAILGYHNYHYMINRLLYENIEPAFTSKKSMGLRMGIFKEHKILISILNKAISSLSEGNKQEIISFWLKKKKIEKNYINFTNDELEFIDKNPVLNVPNLKDYPPFNYYENAQAKGYSVDYVKLLASKIGIDVKFISGKSWNEYLEMLKNKELDFIPHIAITESRKKYLAFTDFKHINYSIGFVIPKDEEIKSIKDFENKTIAVAKGTFLHSHLKNNFPKISLYPLDKTSSAIDAVYSNKADAAIGSLPSLNFHIEKNWMNNLKSIKVDDLGIPLEVELPMGVIKENKNLKSILEKANNSIAYSEVIKLKHKWLNIKEESKKNILTDEEYTYLQNKKEIKMCIDPDWMPFEKNKNGTHIGMTADYIKILEKQIKIPITMVNTKSWSESLDFGKQRKCDIFSLIMSTKERTKYLDFSNTYMKVPLVISTSVDEFFVNNISSVLNKKLGIVKDYAYVELLKEKYPNINLVEVKSVSAGLNSVKQKELFGFIGALPTIGYEIQRNFIGEIKIGGKFEESWELGVGVRSDEPMLTNIFNKAISTLTLKDEQNIFNKWISVRYQNGIDYTILWQVSLVLILIMIFILYKNRAINLINRKLIHANNEIEEQQKMVNKYVLIVTTNLNGEIIDSNKAYCNATGYDRNELIGKTHNIMRHPDMREEFFSKLWQLIQNNKTWVGEIKNFTKNGEVYWLNAYIEPIFKNDIKIGYRAISENITDKKRIEELSITDKLTGLYNRLKLDELLSAQVEEYRRYKNPFSIILVDIDDFKKINDSFGHDIGDKVLQNISKILKNNIRSCDLIGRWGGEEFIIICKNTSGENCYILAENLRKVISNTTFEVVGAKTLSLGVSEFTKSDTISSIFKRVDTALYEAKNTGKNKSILKL